VKQIWNDGEYAIWFVLVLGVVGGVSYGLWYTSQCKDEALEFRSQSGPSCSLKATSTIDTSGPVPLLHCQCKK
jgi:hypothetical protein